MFIYYAYIDVLRKKKKKGMLLLVIFIVHMRRSLYLKFFLQTLWYNSEASILGYYFCYSFLPDITCNLPSHADTFSSFLCQKLCHSKSFLYTPIFCFPISP